MGNDFRIAAVVAGTNQIVALGGSIPPGSFLQAASLLAKLELILLPPSHPVSRFDGRCPEPDLNQLARKFRKSRPSRGPVRLATPQSRKRIGLG